MINKKNILPIISVIIPMYNVEKYVRQCLESLLNQTFQDFEVIVVDDCSTDNGIKVVENYIPRFKGKLKIAKLDKNSGSAAIPRNMGLRLCRGKYISFIDPDDLIVNNAFETLYKIAESMQADVVHSERYLEPIDGDENINLRTKFKKTTFLNPPFVEKNTYLSNDLVERSQYFIQRRYLWSSCVKLYRRDFLMENDINFPTNMLFSEDLPFCFYCLILAKHFVLTPFVFYVYRPRKGSATRQDLSIDEQIHKYLDTIAVGTKMLDNFMGNIVFFNENPQLKFMVVDFFINYHLNTYIDKLYLQNSIYDVDLYTKKEFLNDDNFNNNSTLLSYFFNLSNVYRLQFIQAQRKIAELQNQIPPPINS